MSAHDRRTCDIARGSTWSARDGSGSVQVSGTCMGWVFFIDQDGAPGSLPATPFHASFEAPYDARQFRSQFSMSLANLVNFHVFFSACRKRMFARSASKAIEDAYKPSRGRGGAVPRDAVHVNTYADPASPDDFFEDLNDVLASSRAAAI